MGEAGGWEVGNKIRSNQETVCHGGQQIQLRVCVRVCVYIGCAGE